MKRAYSYLRFSDGKQAKGDSLRRQLEWGPVVCQNKGWSLDDSFDLKDLGISAFRGKNAATGALAAFLEAIRGGKVTSGSVLLVESLDRLSREDIDPAWELFRKILKADIEIFTREPERHYLPADLNNFGTRIEVQAYMLRAFNESATKSMRGKSYWKGLRDKLASGMPIHNVLPAWLRLSEDRKRFVTVPEAVRAVKMIYKWAGEGTGINPITARLNQKGIPPIGRAGSWRHSYVGKLLRDKAVVGEYRPHVMKNGKRVPIGEAIKGYFPQIISADEWFRVRHAVKERGRSTGPTGVAVANLFTGLIRDARDGQTMHQCYSGSSRAGNSRVLLSYGYRNGERGSVDGRFPYAAVEAGLLTAISELKAADVLENQADEREDEIGSLTGRLEELESKIATVQERVMQETGIDSLIALLSKMDKERKELVAKLDRLKSEVACEQPDNLEDAQSLISLLARSTGEDRKNLRSRIKARIRNLIKEIWLLTWDAAPTIRAAEMQIEFRTGKIKILMLVWKRRGRGRGFWTAAGATLVHPDQTHKIHGRRLSEYRTNLPVRKWFDRSHAKLAPAIKKVIDAEIAARDLEKRLTDLEEARSKRKAT